MLDSIRNIFSIPELRRRVLFTLALLAVYRIGAQIPNPGISASALAELPYVEIRDRLFPVGEHLQPHAGTVDLEERSLLRVARGEIDTLESRDLFENLFDHNFRDMSFP